MGTLEQLSAEGSGIREPSSSQLHGCRMQLDMVTALRAMALWLLWRSCACRHLRFLLICTEMMRFELCGESNFKASFL